MLADVYSESRITRPYIIGLPRDVLIQETKRSPTESRIDESEKMHGHFGITVGLPFGSICTGWLNLPNDRHRGSLFLSNIFVADPRLIGSGTGTRLTRAFIATALEIHPQQQTLDTGWVRLGAANALVNALGQERVRFKTGEAPDKWYGWGSDKPHEDIFKDYPPVDGKEYMIWSTHSNLADLNPNDLIDRVG